MNKLIKAFEKNSLPNDTLKEIYGISNKEHFNCIFIAPSWTVDKVFDTTKINVEQIFSSRDAKTFRIKHNKKKYLFITLYIGAPVMIEFCLLCYKAHCDNFVFIGSAGALVPEVKVGDIIVPEYAISGNGATLYLHDKLDSKNLFEKMYSTKKLNKQLVNICQDKNISVLNVPVISMDSVISEYLHLDEFRAMGAKVIEMETATFFGCMKKIKKNASAILVVSDNSATGEHLIGSTEKDKKHYHDVRRQVSDILLNI